MYVGTGLFSGGSIGARHLKNDGSAPQAGKEARISA